MQVKSPRLYEYIRHYKALALPGQTCLQKHILNFRNGFGFNSNISDALSEKTADMDEFSCRGRLILDEMKISEHPDVKSTGEMALLIHNAW